MSLLVCPRCNDLFFQEHGLAALAQQSCQRCGLSLDEALANRWDAAASWAPPAQLEARTTAPAEATEGSGSPSVSRSQAAVERFAERRGLRLIQALAVEGFVNGVHLAVEYSEEDSCIHMDLDAGVTEVNLSTLRELAADATVTRLERVGKLVRVDRPCNELDAEALDELVTSFVDALARLQGRAYR